MAGRADRNCRTSENGIETARRRGCGVDDGGEGGQRLVPVRCAHSRAAAAAARRPEGRRAAAGLCLGGPRDRRQRLLADARPQASADRCRLPRRLPLQPLRGIAALRAADHLGSFRGAILRHPRTGPFSAALLPHDPAQRSLRHPADDLRPPVPSCWSMRVAGCGRSSGSRCC